jgi:hypothetical protein
VSCNVEVADGRWELGEVAGCVGGSLFVDLEGIVAGGLRACCLLLFGGGCIPFSFVFLECVTFSFCVSFLCVIDSVLAMVFGCNKCAIRALVDFFGFLFLYY